MSNTISSVSDDASKLLYVKVAWRIVPFIFIAYVVAFLDRINIGFAQLQMKGDLGFSDAVYGFGAGIFFLGYFAFEVPSNLLLEKIGARKTFMRIMICWGIVSACTAFVVTPWQLYAMRFLLGVFEAGFFPGIVLYLTYWFPEARRASVTGWLFVAVALAGVIGGIVSGATMEYTEGLHGMHGWQWMFILEGLPSVILGILAYWLLVDNPCKAKWLNDTEKQMLLKALQDESEAKKTVASHSFKEALRDPRVYLLSAIYFMLVCGTMAIAFWLPSVIKGAGVQGVLQIGLYSAIPYGIGVFSIILITGHSDAKKERRLHYAVSAVGGAMALFLLPSFAGSLAPALILLSIAVALTFSALPIFWSIPQNYLSGTGAAGGIAVISSLGQLGSFFSPTLVGWIRTTTGKLDNGLYVLASLLVLSGILVYVVLGKRPQPRPPLATSESAVTKV